jgi:hypothetical protein
VGHDNVFVKISEKSVLSQMFYRTAWCRPITQRNTISIFFFCLVEYSPLMWLFWALSCLFLWCYLFDAARPLDLQFIRFCVCLLTVSSQHWSLCPRRLRRGSAGCSLAGITGSNPAEGHEYLLWIGCVVRYRSLRWTDHLYRVCACVWSVAPTTPHTWNELVKEVWLRK